MANFTYLFSILFFAGGASLLAYIFQRKILTSYKRQVLFLSSVLTFFALLIEYFAITNNWGTISEETTTGIKVGILPIEEIIFWFLVNAALLNAVSILYTFEKEKTPWWKYIFKFFNIKM